MPRIVVTCGACNRKHATSAVEKPFICSDCRRSGVEERQAPLLLSRRLEHAPLGFKRARPDEFDSESNDSPDDARIEVSHYAASVVQKRDSEEDARSEASDDWKCTQLCDEDDVGHNIGTDDPESRTCTSDGVVDNGDAGSDNDLDDRPLIQLAINSSRRPVADTASSTAAIVAPPPSMSEADLDSDSGDLVEDDCALRSLDNAKLRDTTVCLICGSSLLAIQNLKGRLHHMKRCSKKSGVSAKDIRWDDDHEMFVNASASARQSPSKDMIRNPYAKHSLSAPASVAAGRQSVSVLSVANVLMEGARLAAKRKKAEAKNAAVATAAKRPGRRSWWQVRDQQPKRACPWYKIIQNTDFCVDGFNYIANTQNFFLSHFHSDHYGGITSSWDAGTIYCSLVTANLVSQQLGVNRKFLHPIPLLTPIVIESRGKPVTVTAIDANHCPGAVMFLFQVGTRNVLHVGDFRWNRSIMQKYSQLNPFFSGQSSLDCIYLDTTYCDEKYALPTQDEAIREAIVVALREFDLACRSKQSLLMLFGAYTIGKERIYMYVLKQAYQSSLDIEKFPYNLAPLRLPGPWQSI